MKIVTGSGKPAKTQIGGTQIGGKSRGELSRFLAAPGTSVRVDEAGAAVSKGLFARRRFGIGLSVSHAVFDAGDDFPFGKLSVFQAADFRAGQRGKTLHAALQQ